MCPLCAGHWGIRSTAVNKKDRQSGFMALSAETDQRNGMRGQPLKS